MTRALRRATYSDILNPEAAATFMFLLSRGGLMTIDSGPLLKTPLSLSSHLLQIGCPPLYQAPLQNSQFWTNKGKVRVL